MNLIEIVRNMDYTDIKGDINVEIDRIVFDSRQVKENTLFVAISGFKVDGHDFIEEAVANGAKALVVENSIELDGDIPIIKVKNSRKALAHISDSFYDSPSKNLNIIGITGTNGKTSTTYFIKSILEEKERVGIIGTLGSNIENKTIKTNNTTPESLHLQKFFNNMIKEKINNCIMEVSSHSIELNRVDSIDFNIGIFTNLSEEHLDFHETVDNYMRAKLKLFYMTKDFNIINSDDVYGKQMIKELENVDTKLITYGINSGDIRAENLDLSVKGIKFDIHTPKGIIDINMTTPGLFNIYNALAATSCAVAMGISLESIKKGLEKIKGVKGRFEVLPINKEFDVIIDFAHSPDGFDNVLKTVKEFAQGRIVTVFGCGGDRDKTKRPKMGEIASYYSDFCVLTSDNSRTEKTEDIIKEILIGVEENPCKYEIIPDRRKAIEYAIKNAKPKDIILLLGKGHETYQIINGETCEFNEFKIVTEILNKLDEN